MTKCLLKSFVAVSFAFLLFFSIFFAFFERVVVFAEEETYSDVLTDLEREESFDVSQFPSKRDDFSVSLVTIAESDDKELFVYCYIPYTLKSGLEAKSINISTDIGDKLRYKNYKLQLLSKRGTLSKYLVKDFVVNNDDSIRYYDISNVYRKHYNDIDSDPEAGQSISEKGFEVGRLYTVKTVNGNVTYDCNDTETIEITDKFVGFCRYNDGRVFGFSACDAHFVAFNTDKSIDRLLEADVYYTSQSYREDWVFSVKESYGDKIENNVALKYDQEVVHTTSGLLRRTYKWNRIEKVSDFLEQNEKEYTVYSGAIFNITNGSNINNVAKAELSEMEWVLRFAETGYYSYTSTDPTFPTGYSTSTLVGDVTILRLKFETDGKVYNLGVVDNKQTGSRDPINQDKSEVSLTDEFRRFLSIILGVFISAIFLYVVFFLLGKVNFK